MPDRNRERHGPFSSEATGEFWVTTQECTYHSGFNEDPDGYEPEILITVNERRQLGMIRVLTPDGCTYQLAIDEADLDE